MQGRRTSHQCVQHSATPSGPFISGLNKKNIESEQRKLLISKKLYRRSALCNIHSNTLQHTVTHCGMLQHTEHAATRCSASRKGQASHSRHSKRRRTCMKIHGTKLQRTTTRSNTLHCTATHCNTLQYAEMLCNTSRRGQGSHSRYSHCNTLQHTATHCSTLQHTATHCNTLQHSATHCNTVQHTAAHYNTLCKGKGSHSRHSKHKNICINIHILQTPYAAHGIHTKHAGRHANTCIHAYARLYLDAYWGKQGGGCRFGQNVTVCCNVLQCVAVSCHYCDNVLQCVAVLCNVLQCVAVCCAVCCSVLQCRVTIVMPIGPNMTMGLTADCCSVFAVCCSVLQRVAVSCQHFDVNWGSQGDGSHGKLLQHVVVCCSVLQCAAVCCSVVSAFGCQSGQTRREISW